MNALINGITSLFDSMFNPPVFKIPKFEDLDNGFQIDADAIRSDWEAVMGDFDKAANKVLEEEKAKMA